MSVYRDAEHAITRAMNVDSISLHKGAGWQNKYQPEGWVAPKADNPCPLDKFDQLTQDSMTRAILHRVLSPLHWAVLVAHFMVDLDGSTEQQRTLAISHLTRTAPGKAHYLFRLRCATAWASPRVTEAFMVLHTWDNAEPKTPEKTLYRWRADMRKWMEKERDEAVASAWVVLDEARLIAEAA
ncbi:hypothetical protein QN366_01495 [Pseudomonas sp. CCC3.2]|uniref:hypothetical protein n=1 Tax=unclassified Pseudomonas TaxID=196821 RepID=UPI002AB557FF|nr:MULTISPECIES: hypothetical protein [unclassified Pseudomonas]MDY7560195.1 hypothetical protein [Pseudomonas sp. AB6]MEB0178744.1 hypothetical protein [Pseudomonas sp. CCC3.2]MEB0211382.1 hypothetical protein [Pseudomonas sp. AB6]